MSEGTTDPGQKPKHLTNIGRRASPLDISNSEEGSIPEFESFIMLPRGIPPKLDAFLEVLSVDLLRHPTEINKQQHHTDKYDYLNLIVRRGQNFTMKIKFNREYISNKDQFWVEYLIGRSPRIDNGTYIVAPLTEELKKDKWGAKILSIRDETLTLAIQSAPDCIVGKFRMYIAVMTPFGIRRTPRDPGTDTYIIFNPWCKDDTVYMENDAEKEECVLNDVGIIYHGEYNNIQHRNWNFGQFESQILDSCLSLMDRAEMPLSSRGNPVKISRVASAMINAKDDDGVILGNWTGEYLYGLSPSAWTGSQDILLEYYNSHRSVRYGQCWVFAGVFNTFMRCLGIPGRVVTNYVSSHDNDGNLITDIILDEEGKVDKAQAQDSYWNYHCWNECWMARSDLPEGFGGWQVVDATPQETSDGMYRCGPASVKAIKHGFVYLPFDSPFVYAEVNSDIVYWKRWRNGRKEIVDIVGNQIGKLVLTKENGKNAQMDITDQYKFPEGSEEEAIALKAALMYGTKKETSIPQASKDCTLQVVVDSKVPFGSDFNIKMDFGNNSRQTLNIKAYVSGNIVYYTGVTKREFKSSTFEFNLDSGNYKKETVLIKSKDYMNHIVEQAFLQFITTASIEPSGQIVTSLNVVSLIVPKLSIKVLGEPVTRNEITILVEFTNPVKRPLENVNLRIEMPGNMRSKTTKYSYISPNETVSWAVKFVPWRPGLHLCFASLDCDALRQVYGETEINVR
ncbi:coagulation factor XIII A chain [Protopterus annectens]|uniref:coagulation factor XIII A chain n=1 Tax=Protopterus annectens TaxID=7888 RepID=UPI001CFA0E10|nr:coagulation factor XIII A chain [Protopterus annectens]